MRETSVPERRCRYLIGPLTPCSLPVTDLVRYELCFEHARPFEELPPLGADPIEEHRQYVKDVEHHAEATATVGVVYYVAFGPGLLKIGTTTNLPQRLSSFYAMTELLAVEPGSYDLERRRHRQFSELRRGRNETFRITPRLTSHVEQVRALHGDPQEWVGRHRKLKRAATNDIPVPSGVAQSVNGVLAHPQTRSEMAAPEPYNPYRKSRHFVG